MRFTWDEPKRLSNLRDHELDFRDAEVVFLGPTYTFEDDRFHYRERRFITLGLLKGIPVSIAHSEDAFEIRVISFRKATNHETEILFNQIQDQLPSPKVVAKRGHKGDGGTSRGKSKAHRQGHRAKRPKGGSS
jgi:uncharacterized protein